MEKPSELEQGLEALGRTFTGVTARLLGPKAVGKEEVPPDPALGVEADKAVAEAGVALGRLLHAAGEGLKEHPLEPLDAVRAAQTHVEDPLEGKNGWSPLVTGLGDLGGGIFKVAEGVLDVVAPRKPKDGA